MKLKYIHEHKLYNDGVVRLNKYKCKELPARFDQNGDQFVKLIEAFEKSDANHKVEIRSLLEKTKLLKMLSNGGLCDKKYKADMNTLVEKLKEHENFED